MIPKVSTLSAFYQAYVVVSFDLNQIFADESPIFFLDGDWVDEVVGF